MLVKGVRMHDSLSRCQEETDGTCTVRGTGGAADSRHQTSKSTRQQGGSSK
jgi:hypothetical protein